MTGSYRARGAGTFLAVAMMSAGVTLGVAAPAEAAACATKTEYNKVEKGMSFRKVKRVFGGTPSTKQDNGAGYLAAAWKRCGTTTSDGGSLEGACIIFESRKVWLKSWSTEPIYCVAPGGPSRPGH